MNFKLFNSPHIPNAKEKLILDIVNYLCPQSDTDMRMAPLSNRYYIVNKRLQYWVKVWEEGVTITNHKFTFTQNSAAKFHSELIDIIESHIEDSRLEFENTIFINEINLLEDILSDIKNSINETV